MTDPVTLAEQITFIRREIALRKAHAQWTDARDVNRELAAMRAVLRTVELEPVRHENFVVLRAALRQLRETVETLAPTGAVKNEEYVGPEPAAESGGDYRRHRNDRRGTRPLAENRGRSFNRNRGPQSGA